MKKILLATALASAVALVHAQGEHDTGAKSTATATVAAQPAAAQPTVGIYGLIDQSYYMIDSASPSVRMQNGLAPSAGNTTRFGFLGSEDLGGGNKIGLKLETQINMATGAVASATTGYAQATTGTSEFFNRAAFLSLSNNTFGEARIGRQVVPLYESVVTVDALSLNSMGMISYFVHANVLDATNAITGQNAGEKVGNASTSQTGPGLFNNGISYKTPTLAGWGAKVFTSPGSGNTNIQNSGAIHEGVVTYGANGFNAVLGYGEMNGSTTGTVALRRSIVGANYTWDRFKFTASHGYVQFRNEIGGVYTLTGDNTAINSVGVRYQVSGPAWVGAEFTKAKDKRLADTWSSTTGLAAGYEFSKRTNVYAFAGSVQNSGNAKMLPVYGSSATGTAGNDYTAYVVGIRHSF